MELVTTTPLPIEAREVCGGRGGGGELPAGGGRAV